jgi:ABC-type siderophore export system fused ATPase/permease subunit
LFDPFTDTDDTIFQAIPYFMAPIVIITIAATITIVAVVMIKYKHFVFDIKTSMVADLCHSGFQTVTSPSEKSKINKLKLRGRGGKTRLLAGAWGEV